MFWYAGDTHVLSYKCDARTPPFWLSFAPGGGGWSHRRQGVMSQAYTVADAIELISNRFWL